MDFTSDAYFEIYHAHIKEIRRMKAGALRSTLRRLFEAARYVYVFRLFSSSSLCCRLGKPMLPAGRKLRSIIDFDGMEED